MPQVLEKNQTSHAFPPSAERDYRSNFDNGTYYPEQRETDMGETSIHIKLLADFLSVLSVFFKNRQDVFLSGNMNLYYEEGNPRTWFAPDLLIAFGVPNVDRSSYMLWREGVFPQVIFEISSEKTWRNDVDEKLDLYDELGAEEYYIFDPEFAYLSAPLMAYHRQNDGLTRREISDDRIFSPRLGLEIVRTNNNFRFFNPQTNEFLLNLEEAEDRKKVFELRATSAEEEVERLKAEIERLKASKQD